MLSLEKTAEELEIPKDAMLWLIQLGYIRLTVPKAAFNDGVMIDDFKIPVSALDDLMAIKELIVEHGTEIPDYLYFPPIWLGRLSDRIPSPTNIFETFDSEPVQIFTENGDLQIITLGDTPSNVIARAMFSHEEIARFREGRIRDLAVFKRNSGYEPFRLPLKIDPAAEAMVDLGNQFFREKGTIPSGLARFKKYMTEHANNPWEVVDHYNGDPKTILIEGIPISYESFAKRYKQYLEDNGK